MTDNHEFLPSVTIEPMTADMWPQVQQIYLDGIATGNATFETSAPDWKTWNRKFLPSPRLVARWDDRVLGWAGLTPYSARAVYRGVTEVSIYVAAKGRGKGVGTALMDALVTTSEEKGIWTLQAGIFPENQASIALHRKFGFRVVGRRERIAQLHGVWRDVLLMERRSTVVSR